MDFIEFPHRCIVYKLEIDETLPPSQRDPQKVILLETSCDIQAAGKPTDSSSAIDADYIVYTPISTQLPRIQKDSDIELYYNDTDIRTGRVRQYEPSMQLGNRIWVKELDN